MAIFNTLKPFALSLTAGLLLSSASIAHAESEPVSDTTAIAVVNGQAITHADMEAMVQQLPPQYRQAPLDRIYPQLREQMITQHLIKTAAMAADLSSVEDEIAERVEEARERILQEVWVMREVDSLITEEDLEKAYEAYVRQSKEIKASHILVETEEEAKAIIEAIAGGADFAEQAKELSTGPSGVNGGDLGFFTADRMVPAFSQAAFDLEVGEVSATPVQTQFGWHIIKVTDVKPVQAFEEVKEQIRSSVADQKINDVLDGLTESATIERFNIDGTEAVAETEEAHDHGHEGHNHD